MKLTEISPYRTKAANQEIIASGALKAAAAARKAPFYTQWVNKHGLNGLDPQGRSVDQVWNGVLADAQRRQAARVKQPAVPKKQGSGWGTAEVEIGRAACRERVCQYV